MYAMISVNQKNIDMYLKKGIYKTDNLDVRLKCMVMVLWVLEVLHKSYSDMPKQYGALLVSIAELRSVAQQIANSEFQLNSMLLAILPTQFC
jgi:hypothetical protein